VGAVALVHDYLLVMRGAERTFATLAGCWPEAPIFTTVYAAEGTAGRFADRDVRTSYLQRSHVRQGSFRRLLPLYPSAVERLRVQKHEVVVSSSSAFAHGVRPDPEAVHVCYCHSPFRYVWHERDTALAEFPRAMRPLIGRTLDRIRQWDLAAAARVTHYIANSTCVKERIARFYGRDATVIHPPVEVDRFSPASPEDYFLFVGELARHKRVAVALEAARRAGARMKVIGSGPELERLEHEYGDVAEFLGRVSDEEVADAYARARALVVPNVEEFGIAAIEAQASGRPVIAIDEGGTRETVRDGETGVLLPSGSVDEFAEAMRHTDFHRFSSPRIVRHARRFSPEAFCRKLTGEVALACSRA
jgi:glycosyltransferase involved in cell wall biosynthesis